MGRCINHPDRETSYICSKHNVYMCEECLQCRDPEIYCKFRPSCPIWFIHKEQRIKQRRLREQKEAAMARVTFLPDEKTVAVAKGKTLLEAAQAADVYINASCNGKGSCGKCKLILREGEVEAESTPMLSDREKEANYVLACQSRINGDVTLQVPEELLEKKLKVAGLGRGLTDSLQGLVEDIEPMFEEITLELEPPSLEDPVSDLDRLKRGLKNFGVDTERLNVSLRIMRQLSEAMRQQRWKVTVSVVHRKCFDEIVQVRPGNGSAPNLGLAIDLGTTSIVVYLVDVRDGSILAATSGHNRQAACGDDVINRIVCAEKDGVKKLSKMALATINSLISEALAAVDKKAVDVKNVVISGNTTMTHLLLRIEPRYIRREPYIPTVSEFPIMKAGQIGVKADPTAAVFVMPGPAGYVGGDIVSGVLYSGLFREEPLTLFIDVGTNGEIVLGNREWMMTASCSAGPAFEGGGIRFGMRAEEGAIEKVTIDPESYEPRFETVGNLAPRGICGSGMIDLLSEMLIAGIIDQKGKIQLDPSHPRIEKDGEVLAYILATADESDIEQDIVFSETDISSLVLSKGAVYAGFTVLLNQAGLNFSMLDRIWITGGFGQYLDIEKAIIIGLLPDIDRRKFAYLGNSSISGAYMALLCSGHRRLAGDISSNMTYIDFSSNSQFMDEFTSALFLPHTNMDAFPNIQRLMGR